MGDYITFVGMDVHARSIEAQALVTETGETFRRSFGPGEGAAEVAAWALALPQPAYLAYESGVTGFHLARGLRSLGLACDVVAVSTLPKSAKDKKQKCDRRDARAILREIANPASDYSTVEVPDEETEGARDLVRLLFVARDAAKRAKQRLEMFLMRHGWVWLERTRTGRPRKPSGRAWERWLDSVAIGEPRARAAFGHYRREWEAAEAEAKELRKAVAEMAAAPRWKPYVDAARMIKGVELETAMLLAAEFGDFSRFSSGRKVSCWAGTVPSVRSSGESEAHGGITKAGDSYLRRALVEGLSGISAWRSGAKLPPRDCEASPASRAAAAKANARLHRRYRHLRDDNGLSANKAKVAVANELVRWVWTIGLGVQAELAAAS